MRHPDLVLAVYLAACIAGSTAAQAAVTIEIDKTTQRMTVSVDGEQRWTWPVSTGRAGYSTPSGSFRAFRLEEDHYSKEWDDAPMPHSIFFTGKGHAIHGSYETKRIGMPASHGCVRLAPENAAKLFALVKSEGVTNTKVVLTGSETLFAQRRQQPAERRQAAGAPLDVRPQYRPQPYPPRYGQGYYDERYYRQPYGYNPQPYGYYQRPYAYYGQPLRRGPFPFGWE